MIPADDKRMLTRLEAEASSQKERIKRLDILRQGCNTPFWNALKAEIELDIKTHEHFRDQSLLKHETKSEDDFPTAKAHAFVIRSMRGLVADVEKAEDKTMSLNASIGELQARIREVRDKSNSVTRKA